MLSIEEVWSRIEDASGVVRELESSSQETGAVLGVIQGVGGTHAALHA